LGFPDSPAFSKLLIYSDVHNNPETTHSYSDETENSRLGWSRSSYVNVYTFDEVLGRPEPNSPNYVIIESLAIPCLRLGDGKYLGLATAVINLRNKKVISLSGTSNKSRTINCEIGAK
jgi:hypothetical protein